MQMTIIGTGNMGRSISTRAVSAGDDVLLLGTSKDNADEVARELPGDVRTGTVGDPIAGDIVFLAIWYDVVHDVLGKYGNELDGKIVVDSTTPLDSQAFEPLPLEAGSAAQEIQAAAPGARVVKAFNTTFASTLTEGQVAGQVLDVLLASDDEEAKQAVSELVSRSGLRPVDAGPLRRAHELEGLGFLHMAMQEPLGTGFGSTVKILP